MSFIFTRTQWPVGHGGFHTGRLIAKEKTSFSYFYDCGSHAPSKSKAKELISIELRQRHYDFGVISHFDNDHFSALKNNKAGEPIVLYLPYMTRTDQLLHLLITANGQPSKMTTAADIYESLKIIAKNSKVFMIAKPKQSDENISITDILQPNSSNDSECAFPVTSHNILMQKSNQIFFKFFNHYACEISNQLHKELESSLKKFRNLTGNIYADVQELLLDIENNPAAIVSHNSSALKEIYNSLVKNHRVNGITPSNLSSLTLLTFRKKCHHASTSTHSSSSFYAENGEYAGWMLTGDLELKDEVWELFYEHYASELEYCTVFSLPHHGSSNSLNWRAMSLLSQNLIYMANVNKNDQKHPSPSLYDSMEKFSLKKHHEVTEETSSIFILKTKIHE